MNPTQPRPAQHSFARGKAPTVPTFFAASDPRHPVAVLSADELAALILRQRPGRVVRLRPAMASLDGSPDFPAVAVYAVDPRQARRFDADPIPFHADYLGQACGPGADHVEAIQAALTRVGSAGGLAA